MKPSLQRLMKQLSQAADALRFADAGDFLPLDEKTHLLGATAPQPPAGVAPSKPLPETRRRVALLAEKRLGSAALRYALNVCERMDADLVVLVGRDLPAPTKKLDLARQQRPVRYQIVPLGGDFLADVTRYAWTTGGLLFVVAGAGDGLAERVADRDGGRLGIPSRVPWVMVAEEARDAA